MSRNVTIDEADCSLFLHLRGYQYGSCANGGVVTDEEQEKTALPLPMPAPAAIVPCLGREKKYTSTQPASPPSQLCDQGRSKKGAQHADCQGNHESLCANIRSNAVTPPHEDFCARELGRRRARVTGRQHLSSRRPPRPVSVPGGPDASPGFPLFRFSACIS